MTGKEALDYLKSLGAEKGMAELDRVCKLFFEENMNAIKIVQDKLNELPDNDKVMLKIGSDLGVIALLGSYGDDGCMAFGSTEGLKSRLRNIIKGMIHEKGMKAAEIYDMVDSVLEEKADYEEKHL